MNTVKSRLKEFASFCNLSIRAFEEKCGLNRGNISNMNDDGSIGSDKLSKIFDTYSSLNPQWLLTGKGRMLLEVDVDSYRPANPAIIASETRPRIPFEAAAGSLSLVAQSVTMTQCEQLPIIPRMPKYDFTIIVKGDSMEPEFKSGDELACKMLRESSYIQWGRPYVVDSLDGVVLKRIHDAGDKILCTSDNPRYGEFVIPKTEVNHLAIVVGLVRLL